MPFPEAVASWGKPGGAILLITPHRSTPRECHFYVFLINFMPIHLADRRKID
jgi:hypothetical protein